MNFLSVTRRTETFFLKKNDSKNWNFLSMTQRIDFFNVTQRIEFLSFCQKQKRLKELSFSQKYDTKNWTSFQYDSKIFSNMTRRIEPFFITWLSKNLIFKDSQTWTFLKIFFQKDSKNWSFFLLWLSKWNLFEVQIRLTELYFFHTTHRIELFWKWLFWDIELFFLNTTQRIEILQYDSEDSTFFLWYDSKYWTFFVWLSELNFFFKKYDLTHRIEPLFMNLFFKMTQRVEVFLSDSKNWTFLVFQCDSKELKCFFSKCLKELNLSFMWTFLYMTQRT